MPLILRVNERAECVDDPENPIRIRVGVVTEVLPWKDVKNGATYFIRFHEKTDQECVGEFRTDNDRNYLCRYIEMNEKVLYQEKDGGTSRNGEVIDVIHWTPDKKKRKCIAYKITVRFEDDGEEKEFFTGRDVHLLRSVA